MKNTVSNYILTRLEKEGKITSGIIQLTEDCRMALFKWVTDGTVSRVLRYLRDNGKINYEIYNNIYIITKGGENGRQS